MLLKTTDDAHFAAKQSVEVKRANGPEAGSSGPVDSTTASSCSNLIFRSENREEPYRRIKGRPAGAPREPSATALTANRAETKTSTAAATSDNNNQHNLQKGHSKLSAFPCLLNGRGRSRDLVSGSKEMESEGRKNLQNFPRNHLKAV